ncbi:unnamed protein product [Adineta steineri]|uniref:Uncharacterized protein n=1 Tax=Adineta steineri TaxID=433720 RepID=A0A813THY0_9BILA|nr:unnamed protein product [Adineta steineri]CAF3939646.1 unnamed protein product [Adineta steineri]
MSPPLRVKIEYCDMNKEQSSSLKFVYLINSPNSITISKLISILQDFIITQFGHRNIHLVDLTTDDGYVLMKNDTCNDILINNEKLICIDMNQFVVNTIDTINTDEAWFRLTHYDSTDNIDKSLSVGMNNTGKLYIYLFGGENHRKIYLFNIIELLAIARDNQKASRLKMKISETLSSDWFVEAKWEQDSDANNTILLIGNLKTDDMTEIQSGKLRINLDESARTIEKWEVIDVSDEAKDNNSTIEQEQARFNELKDFIPPPKRTGPNLDITTTPNQIEMHECEGDSTIRMIQGDESSVETTQEMFARNGSFYNYVTFTSIIISKKPVVLPEILTQKRTAPVEKPISIVRMNVQHQRQDGKWIDCQNAKIIHPSTQSNDKQRIATTILNIEPDKVVSVSVEAAIPVKGKPNRNNTTRSRAHRSLPQPLKLKIIVTDNLSKTCSLRIEQVNEPLELMTSEIFLQNEQNKIRKLIAFIYADDCEYDERLWMAVYISNDDSLIINNESSSVNLQKSQMRTMQWDAKRNKKNEELIDFFGTSQTKVTLLFDSETYLFYAVRIELSTTTSQTVETILLPLNEIK